MTIFFTASMHGKPRYEANYQALVERLKKLGHKVKAEHIMDISLEEMNAWSDAEDQRYHKKVADSLKRADAVFAEVSYSSTSVGFVIATALQAGKPTVIFYSGEEEPHLLRSLEQLSDKVEVVRYNSLDELKDEVPFALEFAMNAQDTRFNFFITPDLVNYLNWISKTKKTPRSVYLRDLIDADMQQQDYEAQN
jgi:hypothetical protein